MNVRPATVEEIAKGPRVEASSLPGRRVIGDTHFCGTEHDLHDNDVIHGPSVPLVVTKAAIAVDDDEDNKPLRRRKHDPRVTYLAEKVAYFREQFRKSDRHCKSFILAKHTTATPELIRTIPNIIFLGKFKQKTFSRKLPNRAVTKSGEIECFVGLFQMGEQRTARVLFRR